MKDIREVKGYTREVAVAEIRCARCGTPKLTRVVEGRPQGRFCTARCRSLMWQQANRERYLEHQRKANEQRRRPRQPAGTDEEDERGRIVG
jgi:hypothetical protein